MPSRRHFAQALAMLPALVRASASASAPEDPAFANMARIRPLFKPKTAPQPGDWLAEHQEPGQSYQEFRELVKVRATATYSTLRLVPIGPLSGGQAKVLGFVTDLMPAFFGLPLIVDPPADLSSIPGNAQRKLDGYGSRQLLTSYLLGTTLRARRKATDAAVLGITAVDLWPGPGWNFVFGQASLTERVGVWSMARNGDADDRPAMRALCTIRTAMTATHETGHMFGIRHCIAWQCGMNGSNHSDERDQQPLEFCPECQAKLWWTCGLDPLARSRAIEAVADKHGFARLAANFAKQSLALTAR